MVRPLQKKRDSSAPNCAKMQVPLTGGGFRGWVTQVSPATKKEKRNIVSPFVAGERLELSTS